MMNMLGYATPCNMHRVLASSTNIAVLKIYSLIFVMKTHARMCIYTEYTSTAGVYLPCIFIHRWDSATLCVHTLMGYICTEYTGLY